MNLISHMVSQATSRPIQTPVKVVQPSTTKRCEERNKGIPKLVAHLAKHGEMSTKQIATDFKMKPDRALKWLNIAAEQGLVSKDKRIGSSDGTGGLTKVAFWRAVAVLGVWGV